VTISIKADENTLKKYDTYLAVPYFFVSLNCYPSKSQSAKFIESVALPSSSFLRLSHSNRPFIKVASLRNLFFTVAATHISIYKMRR
jgi:hypothetical protein